MSLAGVAEAGGWEAAGGSPGRLSPSWGSAPPSTLKLEALLSSALWPLEAAGLELEVEEVAVAMTHRGCRG
jgi:hypothetical protein